MKLNKILVAIDGSEGSDLALEYGAELAKNNDGELILVHVWGRETATATYLASGYANSATIRKEMEESLSKAKNEAEAIVLKAKTKIENLGMKVKTKLIEGDPAPSIYEYAEKTGMDLIVIGSRGLSGFKRLVLGSVSQQVAQNAVCPVFIAK